MDRAKLKQYQAIKKELVLIDQAIDKLRDRAMDVPTVIGKVTGSSHDWPYIETHYPVEMDEPREAEAISRRISLKRKRKQEAEQVALEIEQFIAGIPDSTDRQIFELIYLEGKTQQEVGYSLGYTKGRISQRISENLKD